MERILREPELSEIEEQFRQSFNMNDGLVYYPVRHHSPACAIHLQHTIEQYNPDLILIEGPADTHQLLPYIADASSEAPFCIYYSYDDKEGKVNPEKEKYRAYYPFLDYSPELVAIREGARRKTETRFIDLPYGVRLINQPEKEEVETQFYYNEDTEYEINSYTTLIAKRAGCRTFSEFWESRYELQAPQMDTVDFVRNLFYLGYYMRLAAPANSASYKGDVQRETFMAEQIREGQKKHTRILVIAGAFHIGGLMEQIESPSPQKLKKTDPEHVAAYLMPYTFKEADSKYGYAAGMPFPAFYQTIWKKLEKAEQPDTYQQTVLDYIIKTARYARRTQSVTLPDEINAYNMACSLAQLRGKPVPGVYELLDGVRSCFVKGDIHATSTFEIDFLHRLISGMGAGKIAANDIIPPVVQEFRALCQQYRLKTSTIERQEVILHIIKNPAHFRKSRFLHQLHFLETGFGKLEAGPDYVNQKDKNLMREIWVCRYSTQVETRLIDLSVFGSTLSQICASLIEKEFKDSLTAEQLGKLMISVQVIGIENFYNHYEENIRTIIQQEKNFTSLCKLIGNIHYLTNMQRLTEGEVHPVLPLLSQLAFKEAVFQLGNIHTITEDEEQPTTEQLRNLYTYSLENTFGYDTGYFSDEISRIIEDSFSNSRLWGTALAIYYKQGHIPQEIFCDRIAVYLRSCMDQPGQAASFICGLFMIARDILFSDTRILETLDQVIAATSEEQFLAILPNLRYAFTFFLPAEISRLGGEVALLHNLTAEQLTGSIQVSQQEVVRGMQLDKLASVAIQTWKL